jgi:uncharacterized protein
MKEGGSGLYAGEVTHLRLRPSRHRLRYSIFYLLLDLDEIDGLARSLRLFSHNRFNLFSISDRDHGDGSEVPLREQMERHLQDAGVEAGGPIRLLAVPRILGYAFNPLSIYFCHRNDESLAAIIYEVNNTFGQRHNYLIPVAAGSNGAIRQQSKKSLYVSPFMTTDMTYLFTVVPPGERLVVSVNGRDVEGPLIIAKLTTARRALTDASLFRAFLGYPLLTLKVIAAIHWEALLLWLKGVRLQPRPPPPDREVTVARAPPDPISRKDRNRVSQQ